MKQTTAIVGGGIAGLATAFYLERRAAEQGLPAPEYTLIEADDRLGGKLLTRRIDGFVMEGGPDSFIAQKPWGMKLCRDLGIADSLIPCTEANQKIYLLRNGRLVAFPKGLRLGVPTEFLPFVKSSLFGLPGKLRMAMDLFIPKRKSEEDESVGAFMARRLGREASASIAGPMMAGIYVADPARMSIQSTFPMFVDMERKYGSLIRAMLKAKQAARKRGTPPPAMFVSPRAGMEAVVEALVPKLSGELRTGVRLERIDRSEVGFDLACTEGETVSAERLVLAVPAFVSADLLEPLNAELAERLRAIRYVATALVVMAFDEASFKTSVPYDGFGFVAPRTEKTGIVACTWASMKFAHRAPGGASVIRVFVGGDGREETAFLPDDELLARVRGELSTIMGLEAEPLHCHIHRWPRANPQYDVGHLERMDALDKLVETIPGLHLAGSAYRGIGVPDCVHSGMQVAERLIG